MNRVSDSKRRMTLAASGAALLGLGGCRRRYEGLRQQQVFERCQLLVGASEATRHVPSVVERSLGDRGLFFPGSLAVKRTMRFRFLNPLPMYPATYLWQALPLRQAGYYTAFFWGNDDGKESVETFLWLPDRTADSYYGAHPYPDARPLGDTHQWEVSIEQTDTVNGRVDYGRWHTQAFRAWDSWMGKEHLFHWDLPHLDECHRVEHRAPRGWGDRRPPAPTLTWGDAPWAPGKEVWHGVLRGLQIYRDALSDDDIVQEIRSPGSTVRGRASLWYLNLNPTPEDISDHSGQGHHPQWVGSERPGVWRF